MHRFILLALLAAATLAEGGKPAAAQADVLLRLRSGSPSTERFRVDSAGGFVFRSTLGFGVIPATGAGERIMWHPFKAAFRAGGVAASPGTLWDDGSTGFYSWAGGYQTRASGIYSFAMGSGAEATAQSTIALGEEVKADGAHAIVLGRGAGAGGFSGTFTWADASTTTTFLNTAQNSFQIRASGGVRLLTNNAATVGVSLNAGGSSWNVISDRNRKYDFAEVDGENVLSRIRTLPVTTWRYRDEEASVRHIGPMAQDWHAAFGFSADSTTINMSDLDGVNLAASQALERRTSELRAQLAERDARIRTLEEHVERLRALEERVIQLEALLTTAPAAPPP